MKTVTIYTDGACSGNPGPGGWGAILMYGAHKKELSGGEANTTNNRMELTAVIQALSMLKEPCIVDLWSDSKYVIDGLEKGWAKGWKARGWVKSDKKPALNPDLTGLEITKDLIKLIPGPSGVGESLPNGIRPDDGSGFPGLFLQTQYNLHKHFLIDLQNMILLVSM